MLRTACGHRSSIESNFLMDNFQNSVCGAIKSLPGVVDLVFVVSGGSAQAVAVVGNNQVVD